uniref:Uncharacterized protein n=1 Tax=Eutreptiella gymnastica TaxID=73025 RepID=A0A7S1J9G8_9EUGL
MGEARWHEKLPVQSSVLHECDSVRFCTRKWETKWGREESSSQTGTQESSASRAKLPSNAGLGYLVCKCWLMHYVHKMWGKFIFYTKFSIKIVSFREISTFHTLCTGKLSRPGICNR